MTFVALNDLSANESVEVSDLLAGDLFRFATIEKFGGIYLEALSEDFTLYPPLGVVHGSGAGDVIAA
jgi:hypothetical protein